MGLCERAGRLTAENGGFGPAAKEAQEFWQAAEEARAQRRDAARVASFHDGRRAAASGGTLD